MLIKKSFVILTLLMFIFCLAPASYVQADPSSGTPDITATEIDSLLGIGNNNTDLAPERPSVAEISELSDSESVFRRIFNFALSFVGIIAMIMIVMAGYYYISAHGEESKIDKAKKMIMAAVIGVIMIIASYTIVATVLSVGPASQGGWEEMVNNLFGGFF